MPQSSKDKLDTLISRGGTISEFIDDCLLIGKDLKVKDSDLRKEYDRWLQENNYDGRNKHVLSSIEDALQGCGVKRSKSILFDDGKQYRGFKGVGILPSKTAINVVPIPIAGFNQLEHPRT